ncbi:MAG: LysM peptidoglycan-binding domain-containing protein [Archangium sp.]|nr:LysM peptidoglycan-binding domain-containing protein [Archangium sp.]
MPNVSGTRPATTPAASNSITADSYKIVGGDSMSKIAQRAGVSVQQLVDANKARYPQLESNPGNIQVGWTLSIPRGGATTTPSAPPPAAGWAPKSNNDVVLVGMNESSAHEAAHLKGRGVNVTHVKDGAVNDSITTRDAQGRTATHDLTTPEGSKSFALTLGLPAEQTQKIADIIQSSGADSRDELAQLAQVWAGAERGGQIPSRMVLSGHNVGSGTWGDHNGMLRFDTLGKLAEAMPKAARSVEDLHLSACYSGGEPLMEKYRAMFPNAKTVWAYTGSAPGSYSGATAHLSRWDTATRGTKEGLTRELAAGTRKGENVAVWSKEHGYLDGNARAPLADLQATVTRGQATFDRFSSGAEKVVDSQTGPLREHYNDVQRLLQHPELPAGERSALEARRDSTIRLLYYSKTVAGNFANGYSAQIKSGFESLGMAVPDFKSLSRADALAKITEFETKLGATSPKPAAANTLLPLLTEGLRDLKASRVPETWV